MKLKFLGLFLATIILFSCSKEEIIDYTQAENLVGTSWKAEIDYFDSVLEYIRIQFISQNRILAFSKEKGTAGEEITEAFEYSISDNEISFRSSEVSEAEVQIGQIKDELIEVASEIGPVKFVLQK